VALAQQESSFNPQAINESTGDYGLFQVHYPFWRMFFRKRVGKILSRLRPEDLLDASVNARVASMILSYDMKLSGGDMVEMLGRYSGRTGTEHKKYVSAILSHSMEFVRYSESVSPPCRENPQSLP
jgi:soluble lytic murein transglycosylase-like protein